MNRPTLINPTAARPKAIVAAWSALKAFRMESYV